MVGEQSSLWRTDGHPRLLATVEIVWRIEMNEKAVELVGQFVRSCWDGTSYASAFSVAVGIWPDVWGIHLSG